MSEEVKRMAAALAEAVELQGKLSKLFPFRCEVFWDPGTRMLAVRVFSDASGVMDALKKHQAAKNRDMDPVGPLLDGEMICYYVPYY
ncbi:MAG: hypothetical protein MPJ08_01125 [Nitrosopumilus sp.]|nr:hypothetical protein [Nitrosopumilus sp.]